MSDTDDDDEGEPTVVMDNGSGMSKVGFAGDDAPKSVFPSIVGKVKNLGGYFNTIKKDFVGDEAQAKRGILNLKYPMKDGIVTDWDAMETIWSHIFYNELRVDPHESNVLLTESINIPLANREKATQIMFETFNIPSFYISMSSILSCYASGKTTALVLDIGDGTAESVPISGGDIVSSSCFKTDTNGKNITSYLATLLNKKGYNFRSSSGMEIARDIKEKMCFVTTDYQNELNNSSNLNKYYEMPDGSIISLDKERFECTEILFKPNTLVLESYDLHKYKGLYPLSIKSKYGIHSMLKGSLISAGVPDLYQNIILSGGTTMFKGIEKRLSIEMSFILNKKIKIISPPERKYSVWIGGSILASLSTMQDQWILKEEYDESGPGIIHRKCSNNIGTVNDWSNSANTVNIPAQMNDDEKKDIDVFTDEQNAEILATDLHAVSNSVKQRSFRVYINNTIHADKRFKCQCIINASASDTNQTIIDILMKFVAKRFFPVQLKLKELKINTSTKVSTFFPNNFLKNHAELVSIYHKLYLSKGLIGLIGVHYKMPSRNNNKINCKYMMQYNTLNPLQCPIYSNMKHKYEWNKNNLKHMDEFIHFKDPYGGKPVCKYNDNCNAYKRLELGGYKLNDRCHMKLYCHPPRGRNIKLSQNIHSLIINTSKNKNHPLYKPNTNILEKSYLDYLIKELIANGFRNDLCLTCNGNIKCKHAKHSILEIVEDKLVHIRHKTMGKPLNRSEMLSLILYTGCDCNYALCASQRNGDYNKWKWFDLCLYRAIEKLSNIESGQFDVFSGLEKVKLNKKIVKSGYFVTYTSTSWSRAVANGFMGGSSGMIIQIDKSFKNSHFVKCCDVSWISKFESECEILFARSIKDGYLTGIDDFQCKVVDELNGVQTVNLIKKK